MSYQLYPANTKAICPMDRAILLNYSKFCGHRYGVFEFSMI